jgi:hypothetical protein
MIRDRLNVMTPMNIMCGILRRSTSRAESAILDQRRASEVTPKDQIAIFLPDFANCCPFVPSSGREIEELIDAKRYRIDAIHGFFSPGHEQVGPEKVQAVQLTYRSAVILHHMA